MRRDPTRPRLCGREAELGTLRALLDGAADGRLATVFVEGEAGIGKTRLLSEAIDHASRRRLTILTGRADELGRARPFGLLADTFGVSRSSRDPERSALAKLLSPAVVGQTAPFLVSQDPGLQFRVIEAFIDLLETTTASPVALVLDDMQWADPSTLIALRMMQRRLTYAPLTIVAAMRPTPRAPELGQLLAASIEEGAAHLALDPLDATATLELLADCLGADPGPNVVGQAERAAGNPLYIMELIRAFEDEGTLTSEDGTRDAPGVTVLPQTLRLTFLRRISFLPPETFEALQIASVLGSAFSVGELSRMLATSAGDVASTLSEALRAGILVEDGERLRFRHDLIREAIYEDLPRGVRVAIHGDVARALIAAGAPAARVAEHLIVAAEPGDAQAIEWLCRAAQQAAPTAPSVAADLLEQAATIVAADSPLVDRVLTDRAASLMWAGRLAEGEAICRSILSRPHDSGLDGILWVSLMLLLLSQGRSREAKEASSTALASSTLSAHDLAAVRAWAGHAHVLAGDTTAAEELASAARDDALELGDDFTLLVAIAALALVENGRANFDRAHALSEEACRVADRMPGRSGHRFIAGILRGLYLADVDRLDDSKIAYADGRSLSETLGARFNLSMYQNGLVLTLLLSGDWDDAVAEFETAVELARETGSWQSFVGGYAIRSMIALHRDDLAMAEKSLAESERLFAETGPQWKFEFLAWARAQLLEAQGRPEEASVLLFAIWDMLVSAGVAGGLPHLAPDVVKLAMILGDRDRAGSVTVAVDSVPTEAGWVRAARARCHGLLDEDATMLEEAGAMYEKCGRPLACALSIEEAAGVLGRAGDATGAKPLLERAGALYEGLGAVRDSARVAASLRALGFRSGTRAQHRRATSGWESLTASELKVAHLVTDGLTNPQIAERLFISRLTVRTHLSHIFAKLGLASRTELAAGFARRT